MTQTQINPTDIELLATAAQLSDAFSDRAVEFDQARRLSQDASDAMAQAGFYRLFVPEHLGGLEASPVISAKIFERLAQGNAACGWVAFIAATSGLTLGSIPQDTARTIFSHPNTMVAGVFAPSGKATVKAGEVTVEGRWQWGSGTQNADWILGGSLVDTGGDKLSQHMILMPAQQVEFLDTWHVSGL